jgi:hypothetical protein
VSRALLVLALLVSIRSAENLVVAADFEIDLDTYAGLAGLPHTPTILTHGDAHRVVTVEAMVVGKARASTRGIRRPVQQQPALVDALKPSQAVVEAGSCFARGPQVETLQPQSALNRRV